VRRQEKTQARREAVNLIPAPDQLLGAGHGIGNDKGDLLRRRASGLAVIVTREADGIPPGRVLCAEFNGVAAQPEGDLGGVRRRGRS
jgi:hypothetical protein